MDLLPLLTGHAEEMAQALSDPALHTFIGGTPDTSQQLRARYRRLETGSPDPAVSWCNWVVGLREEACLVGTVQATVHRSADGLEAELAWVVGTPWQGRGIAREAALGTVAWLARQSVHTLVAHIHPDHRASASVAAACGLAPTDRWDGGEVRWQGNIRT
ncbi:GNAT family N-acetyltransferase [Streptomyces sp. NPDC057445]|uniref:GNAT family N-acetyltransferase n=1 Tax=Streptomyces sp. NPDC057445 TaxID=3346136 RepID=UPI003695EAD1